MHCKQVWLVMKHGQNISTDCTFEIQGWFCFNGEALIALKAAAEMFITKKFRYCSITFFSRNLELGSPDHWDKDQADSSQKWRYLRLSVLQENNEIVTFLPGLEGIFKV